MPQLQKFDTRILLDLKCHLCLLQEACPIRIMFIASYPLKVRRAVLNEPASRAWIDQSFDESMVLFHNIIKVLDGSEFSSFAQGLICFEFVNCQG